MKIKRGEIYYADLSPVLGCEQGGIRPVVIIQNNVGNIYSPTTIVAAVTSVIYKKDIPTHVHISDLHSAGLKKPSTVLAEQLRTIDKQRLGDKLGELCENDKEKMNKALSISVSLLKEGD